MKHITNQVRGCVPALILGAITLSMAVAASAVEYVPLTLPTLTEDIRTWTDGGAYNSLFADGTLTYEGIPFVFQQVQPGQNGNTIFYGGTLKDPVDDTLVIPVNRCGVTTVYTLINTAFGVPDAIVGSVTFVAGNGYTYTVLLVEGVNVRDHYYGDYVNYVTDDYTTKNVFGDPFPGNAHFDMQAFTLPPEFEGQTLAEIQFSSPVVQANPHGKALIAAATAEIFDTEPPTITSVTASPNLLWPVNHRMVPVQVTVAATDSSGIASCKIVSVSCNEPANAPGSGQTSPDWQITGDLTVNLRAERLGPGSGRIYTIKVQCTDTSCNTSTATVTVTVPHDQGKLK